MIPILRRTFLMSAGLFALRPKISLAADPTGGPIDPTAPLLYPFVLPPLPYAYDANEPAIDTTTMQIHHDKHHAAYVANLNAALKDYQAMQALPLADLIQHLNDVPEPIRAVVRNNAGGHANHTMFWQCLGGRGGAPDGDLKHAIERDFGSVGQMTSAFNQAAMKVFGSGWAMIVIDVDGKLSLVARPNQDSPYMENKTPLFGNDVWEHAYYLKYQNRRADYVNAFWSVINWDAIGGRYDAARAGKLAI